MHAFDLWLNIPGALVAAGGIIVAVRRYVIKPMAHLVEDYREIPINMRVLQEEYVKLSTALIAHLSDIEAHPEVWGAAKKEGQRAR